MPARVRTYAPRGQTPVLQCWQSYDHYDHVAVMSGITMTAQLYTRVRDRVLTSADSVAFLIHLHRELGCPLLVIWDGSSIHGGAVADFLREGGAEYVQLARLPPYAPDLNPDEGVWRHLKDVELPNLTCVSVAELRKALVLAIMRLRSKPHLLKSCFASARLAIDT